MNAIRLILLALLLLVLAAAPCAKGGDAKPFDLTTVYGETFHGCRILKVTPSAVTVAHDEGVARVSFTLLSEAWKERFNYDPDKAGEFEKAEQKTRLAAEEEQQRRKRLRDKQDIKDMKELTALEKKQIEERDRRLAEEAANPKPPPLAPLPDNQTVVTTQIVVPPLSAFGQTYFLQGRSQTYVVPDFGSVFVVPQRNYRPPYISPYGFIPGQRVVPRSAGQISVGPTIIRRTGP